MARCTFTAVIGRIIWVKLRRSGITKGLFANDGIFARVALLESSSFNQTMRTAMEVSASTFFRPNTLFYSLQDDSDDDALQYLLNHASQNNIGMLLYADNPQAGLGREQIINVWLREQSPNWQVGLRLPNLDLTLLLAYQLARNWRERST